MRPDSTQVKSSDDSKICFINLLWNWAFISGVAQKGTIRYKKKIVFLAQCQSCLMYIIKVL